VTAESKTMPASRWEAGTAPVAVVMISLNEAHNMEAVLQNLAGWAREVFLVDSYSEDETVDIALRHGVHVVQRRFRGFGDQWNFALRSLPISAPWTMKLDPDERLTEELKASLIAAMRTNLGDGLLLVRQLWFMGRPLPVLQSLVRVWRTGKCRFTDVSVNEHPIVIGRIVSVSGRLAHHDSPDLDHWLEKQNRYTTAEAIIAYNRSELADVPRFLGTALQRRMWLKKHFYRIPGRYTVLFVYHWLVQGAWRAGWVGFVWARLRVTVMRLVEYKLREITLTGRMPITRHHGTGMPDHRVQQFD
jgi:glycosyltransferase involved in cell wall biosynthesis